MKRESGTPFNFADDAPERFNPDDTAERYSPGGTLEML